MFSPVKDVDKVVLAGTRIFSRLGSVSKWVAQGRDVKD
jgi:hypothetical protein